MAFLNELYIYPVNGDQWKLYRTLDYVHEKSDRYIMIPEGFIMDLASVPRIFTPLIPVHGKHTRAAVVHDWLYACKGNIPGGPMSRKEADAVFKDAMQELGVSWFKRQILWSAVRIGGWASW